MKKLINPIAERLSIMVITKCMINVMNNNQTFQIGELVKHKADKFFDPVKKITGFDLDNYYTIDGPGKYGYKYDSRVKGKIDRGCAGEYRKIYIYELAILIIIGWIINKFYYVEE